MTNAKPLDAPHLARVAFRFSVDYEAKRDACIAAAVARHMNVARDGAHVRFLVSTREDLAAIRELAESFGGSEWAVAKPGQYLADATTIRSARGPLRVPMLDAVEGRLSKLLENGELAHSDRAALKTLIRESRTKKAKRAERASRTKGRAKQ